MEPQVCSLEISTLVERLHAVRLFADLSQTQLAELAKAGKFCLHPAEEVLFRQGDPGLGLYVLLRGRVKVFKTSARGRTQTLLVLGPGEVMGEVAVLSGGRYPASAQTLEVCETFCLPRGSFLDLVRRDPEVAMRLMGTLAGRLQAMVSLVEDLALRDVTQRVAAYILSAVEATKGENAVCLTISKKELAGMIGTVPETISRIFRQLRLAGAVEAKGRNIWIRDARLLERLAGTRRGEV